jgi:hypothetical protein
MSAETEGRAGLAEPGRALSHRPSREPDPAKWEVDVAYLTRGA